VPLLARDNPQNARLRGGAGRTRTNNQTVNVNECGSTPTSSPQWRSRSIWVSAETTFGSTPPFCPLCLWPQKSVSRKQRPGLRRRRWNADQGVACDVSPNRDPRIDMLAVAPAAGRNADNSASCKVSAKPGGSAVHPRVSRRVQSRPRPRASPPAPNATCASQHDGIAGFPCSRSRQSRNRWAATARLWGSRACVICPSNGRGNTKPSDLQPINPSGRTVILTFIPSQARALILGPPGLRNRVLYFQEKEFRREKSGVASPIKCRFRRDDANESKSDEGGVVGLEPFSLKTWLPVRVRRPG